MSYKKDYYQKLADTIIKNFAKRQIEAYYCENAILAVNKACEIIANGATIGYGGSETIKQLKLFEALQKKGCKLIDRSKAATYEERKAVNTEIFNADYFLSSANAVSFSGEIVNIDGTANRVSYICFGPENVLLFVGMNKVEPDLDSAIKRAKNVAAPINTVRLNKNTPCTVSGKCENCFTPECICSQFLITRRSSIKNRIKVILVGEELGF